MGIPLAIDLANSEDSWIFFLNSMVTTIFCGGFLIAATRVDKSTGIHQKELVLTIGMFWIMSPIFAALPMLYSSLPYSFSDCYFEAVSAMSTTGNSIIYSFNSVSHGMMIWRTIIEIIGAGVYMISSYSVIRIVYIQAKLENGTSILYLPKYEMSIMKYKTAIFIFLAIIACGSFIMAIICDLSLFEAFFISSSVLTTTGVPYGELLNAQNILYVVFPLMFISGLPLIEIVKWRNSFVTHALQIKVYICFFIFVLTFSLFRDSNLMNCLISAASAVSTNNTFSNVDNMSFIFSFIGGCAGSSSGGIKIIRFIIILLALQKTIKESIYNDTSIIPAKASITCERGIMRAVLAYFALLIIIVIGMAIVMFCAANLSFANAILYAWTSITNTSLFSVDGYVTSLDILAIPTVIKILLSVSMILGRLELFSVFAVASPKFWKK